MDIVDFHVHYIKKIHGMGENGRIKSANYGLTRDSKGTINFLPAFFKQNEFDETAIKILLGQHNVSKAVLMQNPRIGTQNREINKITQLNPEIFKGSIQIDPYSRNACKTIKKYAKNKNMRLVKFEMSKKWGWTGIYDNLKIDNREMRNIWKICSELGLIAVIDVGHPFNKGYQMEEIDIITSEYNSLIFVIEHMGGLSRSDMDKEDSLHVWKRLWRLANKKNVYLGLSSVSSFICDEYPCQKSIELFREVYQEIGANKILWGSDIPGTFNYYTYQQMLDIFLIHSYFLSDDDRNKIMGANAIKLLWE